MPYRCQSSLGFVQKDATTPNIVATTMLGVVACMLAVVCKRMQQLPTLLRQQCLELLRECWQWCANGCNNSQQCWCLQCIVGRIQLISLCKPCVMTVRGPNNVGRAVQTDPTLHVALRFGDHGTNEMLGVVGPKVWPVSNFVQQLSTTCNIQQCCVRLQGAYQIDFIIMRHFHAMFIQANSNLLGYMTLRKPRWQLMRNLSLNIS